MKRYERLWERLLTLLGALGEVDSSASDRLRLSIEGHELDLVMTERDWDDLVSIPHGSLRGAAAELLGAIGRAQLDGVRYVVYDTYELHACATPEPPGRAEAEAERRRVEEYLAAHPDAEVGWYAYPPGKEPS